MTSGDIVEHRGHLFVVHGRIESVVHDAAIIPVDESLSYNYVWTGQVGSRPERPEGWSSRHWGRVPNTPDEVWAVSITGEYDAILNRIVAAASEVSALRTDNEPQRGKDTLPLVALPVVGIGLGGFSHRRGKVLVDLVGRLDHAAREHNIDIALVTPDPAVFAAAQYARRDVGSWLPPELEERASDLGQRALHGDLALLLGAGVGVAAGLPSWHRLIEQLAARFGVRDYENPDVPLSTTDQAELIELQSGEGFRQEVADMARAAQRPSLLHALLAGLNCSEVVTTNYDTLYENAVRATGRDIQTVMPWASAHGAERWILKMHGDVDHPDKIVLTRRHMVRYDAANRPSGAMLQSLLLTKRLLIVGTSMTDENVIRLIHEVEAYRTDHQGPGVGPFGTILDASGDPLRQRLWEGQLDWLSLPTAGPWDGPRGVELFLDRLGFHAARDSSWLLDQRFDGLLDSAEDRQIAEQVRRLYDRLPMRPGTKWWPLVRRLDELGVKPKM